MPSLTAKDRAPLCLFSYEDGRRCRTPRISSHPHFCFYHAQKEAQSQAAATLGQDLAFFFSGDYVSANDLSTALARLIPAVVHGDLKPRLARTVAYMLQTLMQTIRLSQHEYINAFGSDGWRDAISNSVTGNQDYRYPGQAADSDPDLPDDPDSEADSDADNNADHDADPGPNEPSPADTDAALAVARSLFPPHSNSTPSQPLPPASTVCHPEHSEGPCFDPDPAASTTDLILQPSTPAQPAEPAVNAVGQPPQPASSATEPAEVEADLVTPRPVFRRRAYRPSPHPFSTNIYTRPGNSR